MGRPKFDLCDIVEHVTSGQFFKRIAPELHNAQHNIVKVWRRLRYRAAERCFICEGKRSSDSKVAALKEKDFELQDSYVSSTTP